MTKKTNPSTPISAHRHNDKRANIPTTELSDFIADDERAPKTVLYPRDPSLDPQLVWKGKDEQDRQDLAVPAVPVYIQEKIQPQAIIENVRAGAKAESSEGQLSLFADFNHIEFQDMVDFYHHEQNWSNRMILGDSLLVMTSLAEKEGLKGKVQMIYIDPPYGIKFGSNWQVSTKKRDVKDGKAEDATRQPEQVKAFRDTWELGIHSYLSYIRDRLVISRELLTDSGSLFVQIGDENVHLLRSIMDEVFGAENFVAEIVVEKTAGLSMEYLDRVNDYLLWYGKNKNNLKYRQLYLDKKAASRIGLSNYRFVESKDGQRFSLSNDEGNSEIPDGARIYSVDALTSQTQATTTRYLAEFQKKYYESGKRQWATPPQGFKRLVLANRVQIRANSLGYVRFYDDFPVIPLRNSWGDTGTGSFTDPKIYVVQTGTKIAERCLLMTTDPGDLVLDPTCGSGTTAYVAEQWGRRWITIDTSRVAVALARTRLMAGRYPYYLLADTPEGALKEAELSGQVPAAMQPGGGDIKRGFVYRRVPHITLKSIANNEEIDAIHARWQPELDRVRGEINRLEGKDWEEWEVPAITTDATAGENALTPSPSPGGRGEPLGEREKWWQMRRERQAEIDASIARRADTELLYDQPYEDSKRVRVSGPFTVESLSPHRVLSTDAALPASEEEGKEAAGPGQFATMILQNLKTAGVQNTNKSERLKFTRLEPYAGVWLQAVGEYSEKDGSARRAAVCIGPEHGTVGPDLIKDAAKEAVRGVGFDLLIVCGFAFDPFVTEEVKNYGRLTVLPVRMNPDLAMGDELLKKTGAGNLFMVFGEPDIEIRRLADGKLAVKLNGVDVYDPTTGEIRSSSTDDIACWMIDTDYNEESFFVRHAYFTGADEPYEKLKRALRAEIDEGAWSQLYATTSMPFERPARGKIAVKVINHYGDEVLKVYEVR